MDWDVTTDTVIVGSGGGALCGALVARARGLGVLVLEKTELIWTCFGFIDDDEAMTERRLRQANLIGPAGLVSMEDGAATGFVQRGVRGAPETQSVVEMGGSSVASDESRVTEASVRGFWKAYRAHMAL